MRARVPGSSANLGPGFDTLALALSLYCEVEIEPADELTIHSVGEGAEIPGDNGHLAAQVAKSIIGHDRVAIRIKSDIPVARGLGSSAALIVATAAAAGADDPLAVAAAFERHCENAAASVMGGLVTATMVDDKPTATPLFLDPDLAFVALIPSEPLLTSAARKALPKSVPLTDAAFNLGRLGWLIAALGDGSNLVPAVTEDRLHQDARKALFPESQGLMDAMVAAGASASCWSGAGPTVLAICDTADKAEKVRRAGAKAMEAVGVGGVAEIIAPDMAGLQIY